MKVRLTVLLFYALFAVLLPVQYVNAASDSTFLHTHLQVSDPGFTSNTRNIDRQWALAKADFISAWDKTQANPGVVVAVIDTGVDQTHEDFQNTRFVSGYNVLSRSTLSVGGDSDDNGHGTLIAGIVAATANNGLGIAGAAFGASIMPIKALDAKGNGSAEDVAAAIRWAADNGAFVINLSLGGVGFEHDANLSEAIRYAFEKGILLVAAAGNDVAASGGDMDKFPVYPVCDDNGENMVLGVSALDENDQKPQFANFGKACVDVAAPGKRILSTIHKDPITGKSTPNGYAYASGTSLAAPFVSAQAALIKSAFPEATQRQIRDRIISTAVNVDDVNPTQCGGSCATKVGTGRINVATSVQEKIVALKLSEGDLAQIHGETAIYLISGGKRLPVSSFVLGQRYANLSPKIVYTQDLQGFPIGSYALPETGTLVKKASDQTVFYIYQGKKLPVTYMVFLQRGWSFDRVFTLSDSEVESWLTGKFLPPADGTLIKTAGNKTVYWVVGGVLHAVSARFYADRGLSIFPIQVLPDSDIRSFPKGEDYL